MLEFRFLPRKACEFQPAELVAACHRFVTARFLGAKVRKTGPSSELLLHRVFRGPTARQGPGLESDSPPRWSVSPPSLSPLMSPLHPAPFLVQKSAQRGRVRRVRFSCRTASGMPKPPNSQVFGGKRAPDNHFAQFSAFGPEKRRACHRFVTALFGAEKCAKAPQFPRGHGSWQV